MSEGSSATADKELSSLGVKIHHNTKVVDYDGYTLTLGDGSSMLSKAVIWVSGITANEVAGIKAELLGRGGRILVDGYNRVEGLDGVFAIGDQSLMLADPQYPNGHPQLAQVLSDAIRQ